MKSFRFVNVLAVIVMLFVLVGCGPSEKQIQKAIAETQAAMPTATPLPTDTPEPTQTPQPTATPEPTATVEPSATVQSSVLGVDDFVFYDGMNMKIYSAYKLEKITTKDGDIFPSNPSLIFLIVDFDALGDFDKIAAWSNEPNVNKMMRVRDSFGNIIIWKIDVFDKTINALSFAFEVPKDSTSFTLYFPEGTQVDLSPFLK
jgi:hypothetical protein